MTDHVMSPDAALCLDVPYTDPQHTGTTLFFFKNQQFICWDILRETMRPGYPRPISRGWPGLLESRPGAKLRGALHVPEWGGRVYFFFEGASWAVVWDMQRRAVDFAQPEIAKILPSKITQGDFTPVYARLADGKGVIYAFQGYEYTRWTLGESLPVAEDDGFPRKIAPDWKDGLVLAPRSGVYVDWPNRSSAHSNRKIYFFMGDLYLRWDVPSNTRNYRLDIVGGWKGWPERA